LDLGTKSVSSCCGPGRVDSGAPAFGPRRRSTTSGIGVDGPARGAFFGSFSLHGQTSRLLRRSHCIKQEMSRNRLTGISPPAARRSPPGLRGLVKRSGSAYGSREPDNPVVRARSFEELGRFPIKDFSSPTATAPRRRRTPLLELASHSAILVTPRFVHCEAQSSTTMFGD
jgi:hypothetical protein